MTDEVHRGSFVPGYLERLSFSHADVAAVRAIGESKGRQDLYRQFPAMLEGLRHIAVIQSTEASNRIEGVVAPPERIRELVAEKTTPQNRSEREIAGYRDVLATIHANSSNITLSANVILQFHRDLYAYVPGAGGNWKSADNDIVEFLADGSSQVRFTAGAGSPRQPIPSATLRCDLGETLADARTSTLSWQSRLVTLDFLCIHPFLDGNGRMARLLTLLLLYQAGYEVGRYVSLERRIEDSRDTYYDALQRSSQGWHERARPRSLARLLLRRRTRRVQGPRDACRGVHQATRLPSGRSSSTASAGCPTSSPIGETSNASARASPPDSKSGAGSTFSGMAGFLSRRRRGARAMWRKRG